MFIDRIKLEEERECNGCDTIIKENEEVLSISGLSNTIGDTCLCSKCMYDLKINL